MVAVRFLIGLSLLLSLIGTCYCSSPFPQHGSFSITCPVCTYVVDEVLNDQPVVGPKVAAWATALCDAVPIYHGNCTTFGQKVEKAMQAIATWATGQEELDAFRVCAILQECSVDCCSKPEVPEQIHLSLINEENSSDRGIMWVTSLTTGEKPVSYVTLNDGQTSRSWNATVKTYSSGNWRGWIHTANVSPLSAGTQYSFTVTTDGATSTPREFTTLPSSGYPQVIYTIGDNGAGPAGQPTRDRLKEHLKEMDLLVHVGDLSYSDGYQARWDEYFREMEPIIAHVPYVTCPGNHEVLPADLGSPLGYLHRLTLPGKHSIVNSISSLYYSFNFGAVHFISLDGEDLLNQPLITAEQRQWLVSDLASVDKTATPFTVVYIHRPLYCDAPFKQLIKECTEYAAYLRGELEELFFSHQVALVLTGHIHNYQRTDPVFEGKAIKSNPPSSGSFTNSTYVRPGSPIYVMNGAGGNREGIVPPVSSTSPWLASYEAHWGYGRIYIESATTLTWEFHDANSDEILDMFTLTI